MSSPPPLHVLVVCVGNVCRSPMIEALLRMRLPRATVESGGVRAVVGSEMHPESRRLLEDFGGQADDFGARQVDRAMVLRADLILTADTFTRGRVLEDTPEALSRTFTLREFAIIAAAAPAGIASRIDLVRWCGVHRSLAAQRRVDITDPIDRSRQTHGRVALHIDEATRVVADALAAVGSDPDEA